MERQPATPAVAWILTMTSLAAFGLGAPRCVSADVQRLLDGPATIRPGGRPARLRVTGQHVPLGESRTLFVRGLTLHPHEEVLFELPDLDRPTTLRWVADPAEGLSVLVDGEPVESAGESSAAIPPGSREIGLRAGATAVTVGEPVLGTPGPGRRPDVLLVTIDTWRRDAFSRHGAPEAATPRLAGFASECVGFDDAIAPASWTIPSFMGLFTGRHPLALGAIGRDATIPDSVETLAERLAAQGYHTRAITQNTMLAPDGGFARGFDVYDFFESSSFEWRPAARVTDLAIAWARRAPAAPVFVWVHYFEPHGDYAPLADDLQELAPGADARPFVVPGPTNTERLRAVADTPDEVGRIRALYDTEVRAVDREIGRLLDAWRALGRLEQTLVVVTSDHGEEFLEHGRLGHGQSVGDEQLRVPLLVRFPGGRGAGHRVAGQVTLVDLAPTILEAVGSTASSPGGPAVLRGRSLLAAAGGAAIASRPEIAMATLYPELDEPAYCIRDGRRKLVYRAGADRPEHAFDLEADPGERRPSPAPAPGPELRIPWTGLPALAADLPRERIDQLRALGYLD
jgi:arylsulfatase A-like enzyme